MSMNDQFSTERLRGSQEPTTAETQELAEPLDAYFKRLEAEISALLQEQAS